MEVNDRVVGVIYWSVDSHPGYDEQTQPMMATNVLVILDILCAQCTYISQAFFVSIPMGILP